MSFSSVLIVSLAAGVVLVIGGGLMMYMANLVKAAYELKVQMNAELDERLTKMTDDLDKKSRWIKRDLLEEIDKIKMALQTDNARKFQDLAEPVAKRLEDLEQMIRHERAEWVKAVESDRQNITVLDQKVRAVRRDLKRLDGTGRTGALPSPAEAGSGEAAAEPASAAEIPTVILPARAPLPPLGTDGAVAANADTPPSGPSGQEA